MFPRIDFSVETVLYSEFRSLLHKVCLHVLRLDLSRDKAVLAPCSIVESFAFGLCVLFSAERFHIVSFEVLQDGRTRRGFPRRFPAGDPCGRHVRSDRSEQRKLYFATDMPKCSNERECKQPQVQSGSPSLIQGGTCATRPSRFCRKITMGKQEYLRFPTSPAGTTVSTLSGPGSSVATPGEYAGFLPSRAIPFLKVHPKS